MRARKENRITKAPEERKQEILDTAMHLFTKKGYEATSMRDIAKEMNVALGLCYRYFESKQILFDEAIAQYVIEYCSQFLGVIHDDSKSFEDKLNVLYTGMLDEENNARYHEFFHQPENEALHEQLSIKMCKYIYPHLLSEVQKLKDTEKIYVENSEVFVNFILYGQIGLLVESKDKLQENLLHIRHYIDILLKSETNPDL